MGNTHHNQVYVCRMCGRTFNQFMVIIFSFKINSHNCTGGQFQNQRNYNNPTNQYQFSQFSNPPPQSSRLPPPSKLNSSNLSSTSPSNQAIQSNLKPLPPIP
jgi:hypothetical protein